MTVRFMVMFCHGKRDVRRILTQVQRFRDTQFVVFSSASNKVNDELRVLEREKAPSSNMEEIDYYRRGAVKVVPVARMYGMELFEKFRDIISSLDYIPADETDELVVDITESDPAEAYMVSYYQPAFCYKVITDNPKEMTLPAHPKWVSLSKTESSALVFIVNRRVPVCAADLKAVPDLSNGKYNFKIMTSLRIKGLIEPAGDMNGHGYKKSVYYRATFEGKYWANRSKRLGKSDSE